MSGVSPPEDELLPHAERPSGNVATAGSNLLEVDVSRWQKGDG